MTDALRYVTLLMLLFTTWTGYASKSSGTFSISTDIREAYNLVFQLRLEEASSRLKVIQADEPDNLMAHYVADFIDFFAVFIEDDLAQYQAIKSDRDLRIRLLSMGDVSSPYYLFVQAEVYIHRALLRLKFEENFAAASDLNQAFKLLKRNQRRFPDFTPNYKSLGMLKAAFGTVPDHYRWAIELLSSMEGTVTEGMQDLKVALADKNQIAFRETQYCYMIALLNFENAPQVALEYARNSGVRASNSAIDCFILSHIALKSGSGDLAIEWLEAKPQQLRVHPIPHLDLMLGTAKLHRLDKDAHIPLLRFLDTYQGKNYRKEALQKLAWHELVHGDEAAYHRYMTLCRHAGCELNESDRNAMAEACKVKAPHPGLLKARLLFDGGYYLRALETIEAVQFDQLSTSGEVEYRYRSGRIYKELGREYDALFAFKMAISSGENLPEYFACAAALYAGILYEQKGDRENAEMYYQICLGMNPENYRSGLHQRAKAGISRMKTQ
jgi:tetratricopeptide (TPR) repeat protein